MQAADDNDDILIYEILIYIYDIRTYEHIDNFFPFILMQNSISLHSSNL